MPDVQLTWLGHATFRFDTPGGKRVYVDPWLTNPKCPDSEKEPERIDMIAITHGHDDHVGNTIDLVEKFGCTVVAPVELADWLVWMKKAVPEDKISDPNKGGTVDVDGVKVTLTDATTRAARSTRTTWSTWASPSASCSRRRTARSSTSRATRTSSETCS